MFRILFFILILTFGTFSAAQEPAAVPEKGLLEKTQSFFAAFAPIQNKRSEKNYLASLNYSFLDFPIPSKIGLTAGVPLSPVRTLEVEYLKGGISIPGGFRDLGSIKDTRISMIFRRYLGNSFHYSYGLTYFDFNAEAGDKFISGLTNGAYPSMNALTVQGIGVNLGLGSSWTFRHNITFGIDWITIAQPLVNIKRDSDLKQFLSDPGSIQSLDDTMKIISYIPRFAILGVHLGMIF